jgi:transcriptional regulator GlxA family with amidase domain
MVARCQAFIQERLAEPVGVTDMARHVGVKPSTFFARFRRHTGMTPSDYLRRARIHRAQDLMLKTGGSILDIAMACGFGSSQYFSVCFREYTGIQPRRFREMFRNDANCQPGPSPAVPAPGCVVSRNNSRSAMPAPSAGSA